MAIDWIKLRDDLHKHVNVMAIAAELTCHENTVVGALTRFWSWAQTMTTTGTIRNGTFQNVDDVADAPGLAAAMEVVGWLEKGDGFIRVPRWKNHNGTGAKSRALAQRRMSAKRDKSVTRGAQHERNGKRTRAQPEQEQSKSKIRAESRIAQEHCFKAGDSLAGDVCSMLLAMRYPGDSGPLFPPTVARALAKHRKATPMQVVWAYERMLTEARAGTKFTKGPEAYVRGLIQSQAPSEAWTREYRTRLVEKRRAELAQLASGNGAAHAAEGAAA